jgi:hypothetical protein
MQNTDTTRSRDAARTLTRRLVGTTAGFAVALATFSVSAPSADASTSGATCGATAASTNWQAAVTSAKTALAKAQTNIAKGNYSVAAKQLRAVRHQTDVANAGATWLIGKPSTDPESDDVPGVAAVLKVGALDHRVTMALVPLFADPHGVHTVGSLTNTLLEADTCRDKMLGKVIALKAGKRDDYVDGLSDTLGTFKQELTAIQNQLAGNALTARGRNALSEAQQVVSKTDTAMQKVFGGGERSPHLR